MMSNGSASRARKRSAPHTRSHFAAKPRFHNSSKIRSASSWLSSTRRTLRGVDDIGVTTDDSARFGSIEVKLGALLCSPPMKLGHFTLISAVAFATGISGCKKDAPNAAGAASAQASAAAGAKARVEDVLNDFEGAAGLSIKAKQDAVKLDLQVKKGTVRFDLPPDLVK